MSKPKHDVRPYNPPFVYLVDSRRKGVEPYQVDLEEYGGNGYCPCEQFQFRCEPKLSRGAKPSESLQCYHIMRARMHFAALMIKRLSEEIGNKNRKLK